MIKGTITAKPQVFAAAVTWAAKFVAQRPAVAVQGGVRLTATDGALTVETYSENVTATATVPVEGDGDGTVIVSARLLAELVKTFADKPVEISADDDSDMTLKAGRWEGTLPVIEGDWPADAIVAPETIGTVDGSAFATAVEQAGTSATDDEKKPAMLHCIHLAFGAGSVTAYATDGHRMTRSSAPFAAHDPDAELSATVLGWLAVDAAAAFIGPDSITVGLGPNLLSLASATREVVLRQTVIDGGYGARPVIEQMLTVQHPRAATVRVADFLMPMKRANLMSGDKTAPVAIELTDGRVLIHAKASDIKRKGAEDVDAQYEGPGYTMALNPKYLADALSSAPGDSVVIAFNEGEQRPGRPWHIIITTPGVETWQHVLMPMRLQGA